MPDDFTLHPQLARDTAPVGDLHLSSVLLMNDSRFPWVLLVPRRPGVREFIDLDLRDQGVVWQEILAVSRLVKDVYGPDKLNTCAIGNKVPQLHIHIVARFAVDAAWPAPVFGFGQALPYAPDLLAAELARLSAGLGRL